MQHGDFRTLSPRWITGELKWFAKICPAVILVHVLISVVRPCTHSRRSAAAAAAALTRFVCTSVSGRRRYSFSASLDVSRVDLTLSRQQPQPQPQSCSHSFIILGKFFRIVIGESCYRLVVHMETKPWTRIEILIDTFILSTQICGRIGP